MPYLQRDSSGRVTGLFINPPDGESEFVSASHPEVRLILEDAGEPPAETDARRRLAEMDISMIRVLEDLLDVLIEKHIIMLTDLPPQAQQKLVSRKATRKNLLADAAGMAPPSQEIF